MQPMRVDLDGPGTRWQRSRSECRNHLLLRVVVMKPELRKACFTSLLDPTRDPTEVRDGVLV